MSTTRILSQHDIGRIASNVGVDELMDSLIERLTLAFAEFDPQEAEIPARQGFVYTNPQPGLLEWMPILKCRSRALMKVVGYHPRNPIANRLPTILSNLSLYDTTTGHLEAIVDGTFLTALRTGAASAVASRLLAKPDSSTIGIIGCGAQSITQIHAMMRVFEVTRVLYFDKDPATSASFPKRAAMPPSIDARQVLVDQLVADADVVCSATTIGIGEGPIFADLETKPHLHINAVGADFPGKFELPKSLLERSFVTPDCREQAIKEGECQLLAEGQIGPETWELLQSSTDWAGLQESLTVFDSTGWALQDFEAMQLVLEHARRLGLGLEIQLEAVNTDPKNPYELISRKSTHPMTAAVAKAS